MTDMLDRAFEQASRLPEDEQNEFAAFIIDELEAENTWAGLLKDSEGALLRMAAQAHREFEGGETKPLNPKGE